MLNNCIFLVTHKRLENPQTANSQSQVLICNYKLVMLGAYW